MKLCPYCGSELNDDAKFCGECGRNLLEDAPVAATAAESKPAEPIPAEPAPEPVEPAAVPAAPVAVVPQPGAEPAEAAPDMPVITQLPNKKQMLSTFQYLGLTLLYGLPVIGLIFLFIFGAGHPRNASLKRFSAAMLILRLVFWIALLALFIVAMVRNGRLLSYALQNLVPAVEDLLAAFFS